MAPRRRDPSCPTTGIDLLRNGADPLHSAAPSTQRQFPRDLGPDAMGLSTQDSGSAASRPDPVALGRHANMVAERTGSTPSAGIASPLPITSPERCRM